MSDMAGNIQKGRTVRGICGLSPFLKVGYSIAVHSLGLLP